MPHDDESYIQRLLSKALPAFEWEEGDSSWDKVRVWGASGDVRVWIYRYESPGPFRLTVRLPASVGTEQKYRELRDQLLASLGAELASS